MSGSGTATVSRFILHPGDSYSNVLCIATRGYLPGPTLPVTTQGYLCKTAAEGVLPGYYSEPSTRAAGRHPESRKRRGHKPGHFGGPLGKAVWEDGGLSIPRSEVHDVHAPTKLGDQELEGIARKKKKPTRKSRKYKKNRYEDLLSLDSMLSDVGGTIEDDLADLKKLGKLGEVVAKRPDRVILPTKWDISDTTEEERLRQLAEDYDLYLRLLLLMEAA